MLEGMPRFWKKKSKEEPSDVEEKSSQQKNSSTLTRRDFLKYAGAAAAGIAIGEEMGPRSIDLLTWLRDRSERMHFDKWDGLPPQERERLLQAEIKAFQDFIRGPEGVRILESGTDEEIFNLINNAPAMLREQLQGTSFEVQKEKWAGMGLGSYPDDGVLRIIPPGPDIIKMQYMSYGNCVRVGADVVMTNCHVVLPEDSDPKTASSMSSALSSLQQKYAEGDIDIAFVKFEDGTLSGVENIPPIVPLQFNIPNSDITGEFITVEGIDPDASSAPDGTKVYASAAIPVTPRIVEFLRKYNPFGADAQTGASFMYVAPSGESTKRQVPPTSGSYLLDKLQTHELPRETYHMHGVSGSPVRKGDLLVGINHRLGQIEYNGHSLDVGFFHGPDEIREAFDRKMAIRSADTELRTTYTSSYATSDGYDASFDERKTKPEE